MSKNRTIDLTTLNTPVLIGRDNGGKSRKKFDLDELDSSQQVVEVIIPEKTYSMNSSFFLGMFGQSIRTCGSEEAFWDKYKFIASENILRTIKINVKRALKDAQEI